MIDRGPPRRAKTARGHGREPELPEREFAFKDLNKPQEGVVTIESMPLIAIQWTVEILGYVIAALDLFKKTSILEALLNRARKKLNELLTTDKILRALELSEFFQIVVLGAVPIITFMIVYNTFRDVLWYGINIVQDLGIDEISSLALSVGWFLVSFILYPIFIYLFLSLIILVLIIGTLRSFVWLMVLMSKHPSGSVGGFGLSLTIAPRIVGWLLGSVGAI